MFERRARHESNGGTLERIVGFPTYFGVASSGVASDGWTAWLSHMTCDGRLPFIWHAQLASRTSQQSESCLHWRRHRVISLTSLSDMRETPTSLSDMRETPSGKSRSVITKVYLN